MRFTIWKWQITIEISPKERYYEILSGYSGKPIGRTSDPAAVLEEEPGVTFREISKKEYDKVRD